MQGRAGMGGQRIEVGVCLWEPLQGNQDAVSSCATGEINERMAEDVDGSWIVIDAPDGEPSWS